MKTIYKYELPEPLPHNIGSFKLLPPGPLHAVHVDEVGGKLYLWGEVEIDEDDNVAGTPYFPYYGLVVGTGADLRTVDNDGFMPHIGSVVMKSGYVWHVYGR